MEYGTHLQEGVECGVWAIPGWAGPATAAPAAANVDDDDDDFDGYDDFWTGSSVSSAIVDDTSGSYNTVRYLEGELR